MRLSAIGDVCNSVPLVRNLQQAWPDTSITWLIGSAEHSLVGDLDGIEFLSYHKREGTLDGVKPAQRLKGRRFDVLLHMQASWRANLLAFQINAPIKLGFDRKRAGDAQWLFTNQKVAPAPRVHVSEGFRGFGDALGIPRSSWRWDIPLSEAHRSFASQWILSTQPTLVISPCSSQRRNNWRNWPAERYAEVARAAMERHGLRVILTGGRTEMERQYADRIRELGGSEIVDLVGKTSLKELLALIERATVVLAPDSGPVHMATATGTPAIGLYATTNPGRASPLDGRWSVNAYDRALRAYYNITAAEAAWGKRVRHPQAMALIQTEEVLAKLRAVLASTPEARRPRYGAPVT